MIYLPTAIRLTPGGSSTVHIYTETVHRTTRIITNIWQLFNLLIPYTPFKLWQLL